MLGSAGPLRRRASAFWPIVLIWLALHAALLALVLGVKFLGMKLVVLTLLLVGTVWFLARTPLRMSRRPVG